MAVRLWRHTSSGLDQGSGSALPAASRVSLRAPGAWCRPEWNDRSVDGPAEQGPPPAPGPPADGRPSTSPRRPPPGTHRPALQGSSCLQDRLPPPRLAAAPALLPDTADGQAASSGLLASETVQWAEPAPQDAHVLPAGTRGCAARRGKRGFVDGTRFRTSRWGTVPGFPGGPGHRAPLWAGGVSPSVAPR